MKIYQFALLVLSLGSIAARRAIDSSSEWSKYDFPLEEEIDTPEKKSVHDSFGSDLNGDIRDQTYEEEFPQRSNWQALNDVPKSPLSTTPSIASLLAGLQQRRRYGSRSRSSIFRRLSSQDLNARYGLRSSGLSSGISRQRSLPNRFLPVNDDLENVPRTTTGQPSRKFQSLSQQSGRRPIPSFDSQAQTSDLFHDIGSSSNSQASGHGQSEHSTNSEQSNRQGEIPNRFEPEHHGGSINHNDSANNNDSEEGVKSNIGSETITRGTETREGGHQNEDELTQHGGQETHQQPGDQSNSHDDRINDGGHSADDNNGSTSDVGEGTVNGHEHEDDEHGDHLPDGIVPGESGAGHPSGRSSGGNIPGESGAGGSIPGESGAHNIGPPGRHPANRGPTTHGPTPGHENSNTPRTTLPMKNTFSTIPTIASSTQLPGSKTTTGDKVGTQTISTLTTSTATSVASIAHPSSTTQSKPTSRLSTPSSPVITSPPSSLQATTYSNQGTVSSSTDGSKLTPVTLGILSSKAITVSPYTTSTSNDSHTSWPSKSITPVTTPATSFSPKTSFSSLSHSKITTTPNETSPVFSASTSPMTTLLISFKSPATPFQEISSIPSSTTESYSTISKVTTQAKIISDKPPSISTPTVNPTPKSLGLRTTPKINSTSTPSPTTPRVSDYSSVKTTKPKRTTPHISPSRNVTSPTTPTTPKLSTPKNTRPVISTLPPSKPSGVSDKTSTMKPSATTPTKGTTSIPESLLYLKIIIKRSYADNKDLCKNDLEILKQELEGLLLKHYLDIIEDEELEIKCLDCKLEEDFTVTLYISGKRYASVMLTEHLYQAVQAEIVSPSGDTECQIVCQISEVTLYKKQAAEEPNTTKSGMDLGIKLVIALSCVAFVCIILLVVLQTVVLRRRQRGGREMRSMSQLDRRNPDTISLASVSVSSLSIMQKAYHGRQRGPCSNYFVNQAMQTDKMDSPRNPIASRFSSASIDLDYLEEEFKSIPFNMPTTRAADLPPEAIRKNRYSNVIPLPHSRVKLGRSSHVSGYINGNYIRGYKGSPNAYIATQAPMDNTIAEFWQMVWEHESQVIIMLMNWEEGSKKCANYVPDPDGIESIKSFGDYEIIMKDQVIKQEWIIRRLTLKDMNVNLCRQVVHFQYTAWPNKEVPQTPGMTIRLLKEVHQYMAVNRGPTVVHCSTGTGRTGALIAIDICLRAVDETGSFDIMNCVHELRKDRGGAVKTLDQYGYIYKTILEYAQKNSCSTSDSSSMGSKLESDDRSLSYDV